MVTLEKNPIGFIRAIAVIMAVDHGRISDLYKPGRNLPVLNFANNLPTP